MKQSLLVIFVDVILNMRPNPGLQIGVVVLQTPPRGHGMQKSIESVGLYVPGTHGKHTELFPFG